MVEPVRGIDRTQSRGLRLDLPHDADPEIGRDRLHHGFAAAEAQHDPRRQPELLQAFVQPALGVRAAFPRNHRLAGDLMDVERGAIAPSMPRPDDHHRCVVLDRDGVNLQSSPTPGRTARSTWRSMSCWRTKRVLPMDTDTSMSGWRARNRDSSGMVI